MKVYLSVDETNHEFKLQSPRELAPTCKTIPGYYWDFHEHVWRCQATDEVYAHIKRAFYRILEETEDIEAYLQKQKQVTAKNKQYQNLSQVDENTLLDIPSKLVPMKHQKVAQTLAVNHAGFGLFMAVGLGKTLVAINAVTYHYQTKGYTRVLVVAPLGLLYNWEQEIEACSYYPSDIVILFGSTEQKKKILAGATPKKGTIQWVIVNYDALSRLEKELFERDFQIIITDESHRIANPETNTSQALIQISRLTPIRLALTGSPTSGSPLKVFGIYLFLDKTVFGTSFPRFKQRYAILKQHPARRVNMVVGYKNLEELSEKMYQCAYRVTADEGLNLPPWTDTIIPIQLEKSTRALYKRLEEETMFETSDGDVEAKIVLTFLLRAAQITSGYVTTNEGKIVEVSQAKINTLRDLCMDLLEDEEQKIVIFCRFRAEMEAVENMFKKLKEKCYTIHGDVKTKDRMKMVNDFQKTNKVRVFCIQSRSGSEGINLTSASVAIFMSLDYSAIAYEQARGRIYRKGQKKSVTYYHLLAKDTVDEVIYQALVKKQDVAKQVADRFKVKKTS